ncbi:right-handed parallel beta-helix repeat-containing protein [Microcoleus sp. FACHB-SPT15]|uniref:beta strand repeat-containing protein n=1 Tax=Microcoleus sp. FACHB-SPT15 TaxID=2692830 RepID=UPI0017805E6F|nr:right-handed parallel beta-helix repeat-containing protein [Microcoleus sp. FACHB-SPT15]MBD1804177.1 right-handed parallel beta-helix repeat-containing protein [Microcoleus sp. FACHB-SPT15]
MNKSAQTLCIGLFVFGTLTAPGVAQTTDTNPDASLSSSTSAADLKITPRFGVGYSTSGAGYDAFTNIEGFVPLLQSPGSTLTFLEGRLLIDNDADFGGNLLLGHRVYNPKSDRILGGYISYDHRDTGSSSFNQIGAGFESLGEIWDFRSNFYLPIGDTRQLAEESSVQNFSALTEPFFQDNFLVATGTQQRFESRRFEAAMGGLDVEAGVRIARLGATGDLRGYAGLYYYDAPESDDTLGWRARLEAHPNDNLRLGLSVQDDATFGTNVVFSIGANFPGTRPRGAKERGTSQQVAARLGESVSRQANIVVDEQFESESFTEQVTLKATNPETNEPYVFQHVNLGLVDGNGTFEAPFGTVQGAVAVAQADNIVYVQSGTNPGIPAFTIPDGVAVLSTALPRIIDTVEFGTVQLALSGSGLFPEVTGTVTLGNDTTLSGFAIANVTGNAIEATNLQNVTILDNRITNPTEQGIILNNVTGTSVIASNSITNSGLAGIFVRGSGTTQQELTLNNNTISGSGSQGIFFQVTEEAQQQAILSNNTVSNSIGQGIFIESSGNTRQNLAIDNSTINSTVLSNDGTGGQGILAQASAEAQQTFSITNSQINDSANSGLFVQSSESATQNFTLNSSTVSNSTGLGLLVQASGTTQQEFILNNSTINNTAIGSDGSGGQGILAQVSGEAQQTFSINNSQINNSANSGLFVQSSESAIQNFTLNNSTVNNSTGSGLLVQASGTTQQEFTLENSTINNTTVGSDGSGGQGIFVQANEEVQQQFTVTNSTVSTSAGQGIFVQGNDALNQNFIVSNSTVSDNVGQGISVQANGTTEQEFTIEGSTIERTQVSNDGSAGQGIFIQGNEATQNFSINGSTVSDNSGQGISIQGNDATQNFTLNSSQISNSTGTGGLIQASGTTRQEFALNNSTIDGTKLGSDGGGGQGVFIQANEGVQQEFAINNNAVSNNASQGIFVQANDVQKQNFSITNTEVSNSASQGIVVQANGTTQQEFNVENTTIGNSKDQGILVQANGTTQQEFSIDDTTINVSTGQGVLIQASENSQQAFRLRRNTISGTAFEGILAQGNDTARIDARVQFNSLNNSNNASGFAAIMNSNQNFCLQLDGNNTNTNFQLQRNAGTFQVVDRDSVEVNNTGVVNFTPTAGDFETVTVCPGE